MPRLVKPVPGILILVWLFAAVALPVATAQSAVSIPRVDVLEFYGNQDVSEALLRQALGITEGSPLPRSKGDAERRLNDIDRVVVSQLEAVCCDAGRTILYVGIEERDGVHYEVRPAPGGSQRLPEEMVAAYEEFLARRREAAALSFRQGSHSRELDGDVLEDLTQGHSLLENAAARSVQERFPALAAEHFDVLRDVLRQSGQGRDRAAAAYILAYADRKAEVVDDFYAALSDADSEVRGNAIRALAAFALFGRLHPETQIRVQPERLIAPLFSIAWTDRVNAMWALEALTEDRDASYLAPLRRTAIEPLLRMARWRTRPHARPALYLLGRLAEMPERTIAEAWFRDNREQVISVALNAR